MRSTFVALAFTLLAPTSAHAAVVITEIAASQPTDHEWVEVYNAGPDAVDLTGYKFFENATNHGLTEFLGGLLLAPGGYALIAQKADVVASDHPAATMVIDSAWSSLREDGEEIGLRDFSGGMVEQFTYPPGPDFPLSRIDVTRPADDAANWTQDASGGTPGSANAPAADPAPTTDPVAEPTTVDTVADGPTSTGSAYRAGDVVINEFMADPNDGEEWVELYNRGGQLINLQGWRLEDGAETKTKLSGTLDGFAWLLITKPAGNLNNRGDRLLLRDAAGEVMDAVSFGDWQDGDVRDNAAAGGDGVSVGRRSDGQDSGDDVADFAALPAPTPGAANHATTQAPLAPAASVQFTELYPNPPGADTDAEFIELANTGSSVVQLDGWQLVDSSGALHTFEAVAIGPGQYLSLPRSVTGLALDNTAAEALTLRRPDDSVADTVRYAAPTPEGQSYVRGSNSRWQWTLSPTPGGANQVTTANRPPQASIQAPARATVGELLTFDGSDSTDPDHDLLGYHWDFGDGRTDARPVAWQIYAAAGRYPVTLTVSDGRGGTTTQRLTLAVVALPVTIEASALPQPKAPAAPASAPLASKPRATGQTRAAARAGQRSTVTGTVLVAPGVLGRQYFYLDDGSRGIQVYQYSADFPQMVVGNQVRAVGTWSTATPTPRLKLARAGDLTVLAGHATPTPMTIGARQLNHALAGRLVMASGVITELSASRLILDDGQRELVGTLRAGAGVNPTALSVGSTVSLTGILENGTQGWRILPRSASDLVVAQVLGAATGTPPVTADRSPVLWVVGASLGAAVFAWVGLRRGRQT